MTATLGPTSLAKLHELATFVSAQSGLDKRLEELARHAGQATHAASCSILLCAEEEQGKPALKLFASAEDAASPCPALSRCDSCGALAPRVLEQGKPLCVADFPCPKAGGKAAGCGLIAVPITVDDCTIGVMILCHPPHPAFFDDTQVLVASIAASLIGKAIQVERVQTLLRSRIAQVTLGRAEAEGAARLTGGTLPPTRLAKLLARSFYKDLAAAGFQPGQIIEAATEIIGEITADMGRLEKRMARKSKKETDAQESPGAAPE